MSDDALPPGVLRRRSCAWRLIVLLSVLISAACASAADPAVTDSSEPAGATSATAASGPTKSASSETLARDESDGAPVAIEPSPTAISPMPAPASPVAGADTALPAAGIGLASFNDGQADTGPKPISLKIGDIGVNDATVIAVGVNEDQSFEVPPADQVGWYRFGPTPGAPGSAVLAAHIAFDGVDGVFRDLSAVQPGAIVEVEFDDGSTQQYRIEAVEDYFKEELPAGLWTKTGRPQLALITCGGVFDSQRQSYESNTVAIAVPV